MHLTSSQLRDCIDRFPRVRLAALPTPLEECPRLSAIAGARLSMKRDDLTGLALGGNKTRQLEFIIARALAEGADVLVTMAALQSNQCRQTAAAGSKVGLPVHLVLRGEAPEVPDGNLLLDGLLGAQTITLPAEASKADINAAVNSLVVRLCDGGHRPYVVDLMNDDSPDQELAAISYALMVCELSDQSGGSAPDWIYLSSGSGGSATLAGTWIGCRALGWPTRVVGVSAGHVPDSVRNDTLEIASRAVKAMGLDLDASDEPQTMFMEPGFVGPGYGHATDEGLKAMRLAARAEGLVLDPIYTGKALAALIAHVRQDRVSPCDSAVFVHTGGTPLTFLHQFGSRIAGEN